MRKDNTFKGTYLINANSQARRYNKSPAQLLAPLSYFLRAVEDLLDALNSTFAWGVLFLSQPKFCRMHI